MITEIKVYGRGNIVSAFHSITQYALMFCGNFSPTVNIYKMQRIEFV
jgi:hypothetical protein